MLLVALIGQLAFVVASVALGIKLLALWRRTRQLSELCMGLSFLLSGGLGYVSWFVLAVVTFRGGSPELRHAITAFGLAASFLGAIAYGVGCARIFRPGRRGPALFVATLGTGMIAGWTIYVRAVSGHPSFWIPPALSIPIFAWGAIESLLLWSVLRKRVRLGLADPLVVNRTGQWGLASLAIALMIALSCAGRVLYGTQPVAWLSVIGSALCLAAAVSIWLGFFPPRSLRDRLAEATTS
jgi:hypothetical protein